MKYSSLTQQIYTKIFITTFVVQIVTTVSFFLDFIIPGSFLGEEALSAITLTMPLVLLMQAFADMMSLGGSNAFSMEIGSGNKEKAHCYFTATLAASFVIGLVIMIIGLVFIDPLVEMLGASGDLFNMTRQVTMVSLGFFPIMPLYISLDFFVRNDGRVTLAMISNVVFIVCNVILDIYFVGYTTMGIVGAPLASITSAIIGMIILSIAFFHKNTILLFTKKMGVEDIIYIMKTGSGLTFRQIYQGVTTMIFNNLIMRFYGGDGVVVYTVIVNVMALATGFFASIRETIQPIIGTYMGENHVNGIRATMKIARDTGVFFCILLWLFLEFMPTYFLHIFGIYDEALLLQIQQGIQIYAYVFPFLCFTEIMSSYYQFIGYPRLTFMILTMKGLLLMLPVSALGLWLGGLNGLWLGFIVTEILAVIYLILATAKKARQFSPPVSSLMLLDKSKQRRLTLEIELDIDSLMDAVYSVHDFLQQENIEEKYCNPVCLALEELGGNMIQHNPDQNNRRLEIQLIIHEELTLILRDNCRSFNTEEKREAAGQLGLRLVRGVSNNVSYLPTIGYNRTILSFEA